MPGLIAFTRTLRSLRSTDQVRANERTAALVALYTLKAGLPVVETIDAFSTIDPPGCSNGSAFCTVNSSPLTFTSNCLSKCSSLICSSGANAPAPAFAKTISSLPFSFFSAAYSLSISAKFETSPWDTRHVMADLAHSRLQFALSTSCDEYVRTFIDETLCRRQSNSTAASGNHGNLPCEFL